MREIEFGESKPPDVGQIPYQSVSLLNVKLLKDWASALFNNVQALNSAFNAETDVGLENSFNFYDEVRHFEVQLIVYALHQTRGHQRQAARLLGLKATTFNAKLKLYNIAPRNPFAALHAHENGFASNNEAGRNGIQHLKPIESS